MQTDSFRRFVSSLFIAALVCLAAFNLNAQENRDWLLVESENFKVHSTLSEKDSIELVKYLESARIVIAFLTNIKKLDEVIPTEIFVVKNSGDLNRFGIDSRTLGIFYSGLRNNTILLRDSNDQSANRTILHEYVHYLMNNNSSVIYPKWYSEGLAEYLSAADFKQGTFRIGLSVDRQIRPDKYWMPLSTILSGESTPSWRANNFYGQSWALVHYLHNEPGYKDNLSSMLSKYIRFLNEGEDSLIAFEMAFETKIDDLDYALKRYIFNNRITYFSFDASSLIPGFNPQISEMSRPEIALKLANLDLVLSDDLEKAERLYSLANEDESLRSGAQSGIGKVYKAREDFDGALPFFEKALELDDQDPYLQLDMAQYWHDYAYNIVRQAMKASGDALAEGEIILPHKEYIAKARQYYVNAWRLDDSIPEVYLSYGRTYLIAGEDKTKAISMLEEASYLLPSSLGIKISLANAYLSAGKSQDAMQLARLVLSWAHEDSPAANWAKEVLGIKEVVNDGPA